MKRLAPVKIDDAAYYEPLWRAEVESGRGHYDVVRQRALAQQIVPGVKVVDLGAGVYGTAQYIAERMASGLHGLTLVAYDQSYTAREVVQKMCPQLLYLLGSVEQTIFPDAEFDCVVAGEVIEHMEDPAAFVTEMCRICKPGGWLTLSTVDTNCVQAIAHGPYPEHLWEFTPEDLLSFFRPHGNPGYSLVGNYHFILCQRHYS